MNVADIDRVLALLTADEVTDALWMIDVFERWDMPREEADAWRLRILGRQWFLKLDGATTADAPDTIPARFLS